MLCNIYNKIKDPLYKNSIYLILSSLTAAGFGFIFWILAARLYSPEDVGLATAMISSAGIIGLLAKLGFDQSIIRFFPEMNKGKVFFSSLIVTSVASLLFGVIYLVGIDFWAPKLSILQQYPIIFIGVLFFQSVITITGIAFVALRKGGYYLIQNMLNGSRIVFLIPLVFLGALGIFSSLGIAFALTSLLPVYFLYRFKIRLSGIDTQFLRESLTFSTGNYFSGIFLLLPPILFPLLILNILDAEQAAIYYIVYSIISLLLVIPTSFGTSLFVEGSHGEPLAKSAKKALFATFLILIPAVVVIFLFGNFLLQLMGSYYVQGFDLLKLMAISTIFYAVFQVFISVKKTEKDIKAILFLGFGQFVLIIASGYLLLNYYGLIGIGYAWILVYGIFGTIMISLKEKNKS